MIKKDQTLTLSTGDTVIIHIDSGSLVTRVTLWSKKRGEQVCVDISAKDLRDMASMLYSARDDIEHNDPDVKEERF